LNYNNEQRDEAKPHMVHGTWVLKLRTANACSSGYSCDDVKSERVYGRKEIQTPWTHSNNRKQPSIVVLRVSKVSWQLLQLFANKYILLNQKLTKSIV